MPLRSAGRGFDEEWPTVAAARHDHNHTDDDTRSGISSNSRRNSYNAPPPPGAFRSHSHSADMNIQPSDCVVTTPSYGPADVAGPDDFSFVITDPIGASSSTNGGGGGISVISDAHDLSQDHFYDDGIIIEDESANSQRRLPILTSFLHQRRTCLVPLGLLVTLLFGISLGTGLSRRNNTTGAQSVGFVGQNQWGLVPTSPRYLPLRDALVKLHGGDRTPFISIDSVHHQALLFLADEDPRQISPNDPSLAQRFALAMLFYSTYGMTWHSKLLWMTGENECEWEGVFCAHDGEHVDSLVLQDNGLKGTISDLSLMHDLQIVDLSNNKGLKGTMVPESFGSLHLLRALHLHSCGLVGGIPDSIWTERLEIIDLSYNEISGHLSPAIKDAVSLQKLLLESNVMDGTIPDAIGGLPLLNEVRCGSNNFSGEIPDLDKLAALRVLALQNNQLIGSLPVLPKDYLRVVDVSNNTLVGVLGSKVKDLPELMELNLQNNFFSDNLDELDLSRSLQLEILYLNDNHFRSTSFPEWVAPLIQLRELQLYGNAGVVGSIPDVVCDLVNFVQSLDVLSVDCNKIVCTCCTHCCTALGDCMQEKPDEFSI